MTAGTDPGGSRSRASATGAAKGTRPASAGNADKAWQRIIEEIPPLSQQFHTTLRASFERLKLERKDLDPAALAEVERLLAEKPSWARSYEIEQLLVELYDPATLAVELKRRVLEGKSVLGASLAAWYEDQAKSATTTAEQRVLLARLVNDLQWRYMVDEVRRGYTKEVTRYTGWIFVVCLALFAAWLVMPYLLARPEAEPPAQPPAAERSVAIAPGGEGGSSPPALELRPEAGAEPSAVAAVPEPPPEPTGADVDGTQEDVPGEPPATPSEPAGPDSPRVGEAQAKGSFLNQVEMHRKSWYLLLLAGFAGAWGASFSMLTGLKKRIAESDLNELKVARSEAVLISRPLIGLGAAFIFYFFVTSGLVEGSLFPDFSALENPLRALAVLVVWSFIAGFSEKLVPGMLARTEQQALEPRAEAEQAGEKGEKAAPAAPADDAEGEPPPKSPAEGEAPAAGGNAATAGGSG